MMFENEKSEEQQVLEKFLSMSVKSSDEVFDAFKEIEGAKLYGNKPLKRFIYIPGNRDDRVLLVAHADTVWDNNWQPNLNDLPQKIRFRYNAYMNENKEADCGIGADDRAGCAILYLLKNSGHSLLILDGEEHGQVGANFLKNEYPELFNEINNHQYMFQFDRRNNNEFKCYNIPVTNSFKLDIAKNLRYWNAGKSSTTDIAVLCKDICGANLSVGYYNEHTRNECLIYTEWLKTYKKVSKFLSNEQKKYPSKTQLKNFKENENELTA